MCDSHSRAGPNKNSVNGSSSSHNLDKNVDNNEAVAETRSPRTIAHNISINVTDADSPVGVRRRIHLRSLSDVTPAGRSPGARARSHSDRPRAEPAPSAAVSLAPSPAPSPSPRVPPASPRNLVTALYPRVVRSERSSPDASLHTLVDDARPRTDALTVSNDPWRKMSEVDLKSAGRRMGAATRASLDSPHAVDPWVRNPASRAGSRDELSAAGAGAADAGGRLRGRRGKLERAAAVVCEACGGAGCECRRAQCTCPPRRSPRPSPARLAPRAPLRAHSDDEERPRRLYKSASQKIICSSVEREPTATADPLLETTC
ncbi:unnamed protein product [Colias eurytheme]|nr:unnamed protein product [Colias eurytheme]